MKLILFDIDGTLLISDGAGTRAANRAFEAIHGVANVMEGIDAAGKTDPLILEEMYRNGLERSYTSIEAEELYALYVGYLEEEVAKSREFTVMPGVRPLLGLLGDKQDVVMGVATGNIERGAMIKLGHCGLDRHFKLGGYGSDSAIRQELILIAIERAKCHLQYNKEFQKVFVIGDTPHDISHGKAAGAITIAVATGSYTAKQLDEHEPDYLFDDLSKTDLVFEIFE